jgi:hypothetical protein
MIAAIIMTLIALVGGFLDDGSPSTNQPPYVMDEPNLKKN